MKPIFTLLRDLAKAKALAQQLALKAILEAKPPEGQKHEKPVDDLRGVSL